MATPLKSKFLSVLKKIDSGASLIALFFSLIAVFQLMLLVPPAILGVPSSIWYSLTGIVAVVLLGIGRDILLNAEIRQEFFRLAWVRSAKCALSILRSAFGIMALFGLIRLQSAIISSANFENLWPKLGSFLRQILVG